jgi:glycosyltransferase involved in cell wall biosynthesis
MNNIFYIWPHDFRWKNNVLGQRLIMLDSLGLLKVLVRRSKWLPINLGLNIRISVHGLSARINEYVSITTYILSVIFFLSVKRVLGTISRSDIVYTNFEYSILIGIWAKEVLGMKWVADFFDDPRRGYFNASLRKAPKLRVIVEKNLLGIYRYFLKQADLVICNSPDFQRGLAPVLVSQFKVEKARMITVPGGVHEQYIESCLSDPELNKTAGNFLKEKGIEEKGYIYLVGHINSDVSGVHNVLRALRILLQEGFPYHVVLAGFCKPKELIWLQAVVERMGLSGYVHYLGVVEQPLSYVFMKNAGCCVCPYNTDGRSDYMTAYPIKLLEYLTVGAPTIAVQTPITEQIVIDFGSGELVPSSSEWNLVRLIKALHAKGFPGSQGVVPVAYRWMNINKTLRTALEKMVIEAQA